MAFEKQAYNIQELKENFQALKYSSTEYLKLNIYKNVIKIGLTVVNMLLVVFVGLFALVFLSVAVAISISNAMDSPSAGFYIVAGFYLLLIILFFAFGKKYLQKKVLLQSSRKFFND